MGRRGRGPAGSASLFKAAGGRGSLSGGRRRRGGEGARAAARGDPRTCPPPRGARGRRRRGRGSARRGRGGGTCGAAPARPAASGRPRARSGEPGIPRSPPGVPAAMEQDKYLPELMAEKDSLDPCFVHAMRLLEDGEAPLRAPPAGALLAVGGRGRLSRREIGFPGGRDPAARGLGAAAVRGARSRPGPRRGTRPAAAPGGGSSSSSRECPAPRPPAVRRLCRGWVGSAGSAPLAPGLTYTKTDAGVSLHSLYPVFHAKVIRFIW